MTTTTRNEAAERLLDQGTCATGWIHAPVEEVQAALAAERRATVRDATEAVTAAWPTDLAGVFEALNSVRDEEAAR